MSDDIIKTYHALPQKTRDIIESVGKEELIKKLSSQYHIPLQGLLMQLLTGNTTTAVFVGALRSLVKDFIEQKNLLYVIEENFLKPFETLTKKPEDDLDHIDKKGIQVLSVRQKDADKKKFYDLGKLAEVVMEKFVQQKNIPTISDFFNNPILVKRLKDVLVSYLKDIRDKMEVKHTLMRSAKIGGMGFREKDTTLLLEMLETERSHIESYVKEVVFSSVDNIKNKDEQVKKEEKIIPTKSTVEPVKKLAPPPPAIITPVEVSNVRIREVAREEQAPRIKQSVQFTPRLVGPVEELRRMTLVDFRRLSSLAKEAVEKIKMRIELLAQESLERRDLGIQAWQDSEVYQEYLSLGKESFTQGKALRTIIENRLEQGRETLTKDEFDAIMELNKYFRN